MAASSQSHRLLRTKTYIGKTGLTTPPFFLKAHRGAKITWGVIDDSPVIVNWSGLDPSEQAEITLTLEAADNWSMYTHPLGPEKSATPPIPTGDQRILYTAGKTGRERGWWRTGTDKLASYGLDTEVWISQDSTISNSNILALEVLLQTKSEKYLLNMRSDGVESLIYWTGAESGLMDIYNFPGVIYATDASKGSTGIGAGFYPHNTKGGGCCRVGGGTAGSSSGRAKFAAAYLALEDSRTHDQPIAVLTDSKGFMTGSSNWVGDGKDPLLCHALDEDLFARINVKADRWADEGREDVDNVRWDGPSLNPTFL